jgi:hypothetical protein
MPLAYLRGTETFRSAAVLSQLAKPNSVHSVNGDDLIHIVKFNLEQGRCEYCKNKFCFRSALLLPNKTKLHMSLMIMIHCEV